MVIYGTGLLAISLLVGLFLGRLLGLMIGVDANVGGVGIAMLILIIASNKLQIAGHLPRPSQNGVIYWSSIYIPIVVAMAASQNVRGALTGGPAAIAAGVIVVVISFAMVPLLSRVGNFDDMDSQIIPNRDPSTEDKAE